MTVTLVQCFIVVPLLLSLSAIAFGQAKPPTKQAGSISGRVMLRGKPLPDVGIVVRRSDSSNPFERFPSAITDQQGVYKISNLPIGILEVQPAAPAYVVPDSVGTRSKTIVLSAGENVEGVDFTLEPGGVVTGRVKDANNRPSIQQQVSLYLAEIGPGGQMFAVATGTTDDRGVYRIFGLRHGRYKVATGRSESAFSTGVSNDRPSFRQVFYPNVNDPAKAEVIEIDHGTEVTGIDLTLGANIETHSAKGRTIDAKNSLPVPYVSFGLVRLNGEQFEPVSELVTSNANGEFIVEGLIPGKYLTFLKPEPNSELRLEATTLEVTNSDVEDIVVKLTRGVAVSGVIALETADQTAAAKLSQMEVRGQIASNSGPFGAGQSAISTVGLNGAFRLAGLSPGTLSLALVDARDQMKPSGFFIIRVEREGVLQAQGLEVREGEDISGVRLVVGYGSATLRGVVELNGPLPPGGRIVVRLTKVGDTANSIRPPRVDTRGHFLLENLPGGAYELAASISVSGKIRYTAKRHINLADSVVTDVTITMDVQPSDGNLR